MTSKISLRPVQVYKDGKKVDGFFHRFVYVQSGYYSETRALVELKDGKLRYFDPYFVQFTDRITADPSIIKQENK